MRDDLAGYQAKRVVILVSCRMNDCEVIGKLWVVRGRMTVRGRTRKAAHPLGHQARVEACGTRSLPFSGSPNS